jgi:predicted MFS family arabinose efflux permease
VVAGPLGDARGKLEMVIVGALWAGIGTVVAATMPSLGPLMLVRFLAGAGAAAVIPVALAWIGDVVAYDRRQAVLARFLSGQILGIVFGQAAGGLLGDLIGWRPTMGLLGLVHIGAGLLLVAEMRRFGLRTGRRTSVRWSETAALTGDILRRPWVRVVLGTLVLEGMAMFGALAYIGAELNQRFGLSLGMVGAMLAAFGVGALVYASSAGTLVARLGQPGSVALGAVLLAGGYATLGLMPSPWYAPPAIALVGFGYYMLHTTLQTHGTQMAPEARGLAMSLFAFTLFTAHSLGVALAAPVMDRYGARPIFLAAAAVILLVAFWFRRQLLRKPD